MSISKAEELRDQCVALQNAMDASRQTKPDDTFLFASFKTFMRKYNELALKVKKEIATDIPADIYNLDKVPGPYDTILAQQRVYFDEVYCNLSILRSFVETRGGLRKREAENILNFLKANLRKAIYSDPNCEKDVQNSVESLLVGKGMQKGVEYDRETGRVKVAGKESIPDFIFPPEEMALEIKFSNKQGKLSTIIDEINSDIVAYSKQYSFVWFLVYDMGFIRDEDEVISGLEQNKSVKCVVVKH